MEEKIEIGSEEKTSSLDEIIQVLISLKGRPMPTEGRLFSGDIPKEMHEWRKKMFEEFEAGGDD